jgi:electron transport complex protein RnfD
MDARHSPALHTGNSVSQIMTQVMLALVPGLIAYVWFFGFGVVINILLAAATAAAAEAAVLLLRGRQPLPILRDNSAVLTGVLLALCLPPLAPWWITVIGALFAIVVVKQLFGGLGYNPFNPAMAGFVLLLISFPLEMTQWIPPSMLSATPPDLVDSAAMIFSGHLSDGRSIDAITQATPLDAVRNHLLQSHMLSEFIQDPIFHGLSGVGWQWINGLFLLGGLWLIRRRIIGWQIPAAMLGALFISALIFRVGDSETYTSPLFHLFSGGAMLGAFFIATDPVTSSTTNRGRLWFGAGVGVLTYVIRTWGGYPDGIAFAVLLMNITAPTIDYYTRPRVFGHEQR